jgi:hypothetical protein
MPFLFVFQSFSVARSPLQTATRNYCQQANCVDLMEFSDSCFCDLSPGDEGGAMYVYVTTVGRTATLRIRNCCFYRCTAEPNGGAIWARITYFVAIQFDGQQCSAIDPINTPRSDSGDFIHVESASSTEVNDSSTFLGGEASSGSTRVKSGSLSVSDFNATANFGASQNNGNGLNTPDNTVVLALVRFHSNGPHNCLYLNKEGESTGRIWCVEFFNNTADQSGGTLIRSTAYYASTYRFDYCVFRSNSGGLADSLSNVKTLIFTDCTFTEGEVQVGSMISLTTPGCRALASEEVHLDPVECPLGLLPATSPLPSDSPTATVSSTPPPSATPLPTVSATAPATLSLPQPIFL